MKKTTRRQGCRDYVTMCFKDTFCGVCKLAYIFTILRVTLFLPLVLFLFLTNLSIFLVPLVIICADERAYL
jgi:hypothetical protein